MRNVLLAMSLATLSVGFSPVYGGCDAEGFSLFDGRVSPRPPSDFFILRFEHPDGIYTNGWYKGQPRWVFTEIRQLKSGTTMVADGVRTELNRRVLPCNWVKWIRRGSRNVRVKFVDADYTLAEAGKKPTPEGFEPMFVGENFDGWQGAIREEDSKSPGWRRALAPDVFRQKQAKADESMHKHWSWRDGAVFFDGGKGGTSIATKRDYRNFEMLVDWRLLRVYGDSGFYLRGMSQVQIWDPNSWGGQGSGGLWNNENVFSSAMSRQDRLIGDWNTFRMRMVGDRISVWFNDVLIVDAVPMENCWNYNWPIPMLDNIQLQCHGDPIEFRNLFIRELPEDLADVSCPANAIRSGEKIDLLAKGIDGWRGEGGTSVSGWGVQNGVLTQSGPSTRICSERDDFLDFDLSYDVNVPSGCSAGVFLRGIYEVKASDSYGKAPNVQSMGALNALIAPSSSAERKAGEWQHIDLTIYKRRLTIRLNGELIVDNKPIAGVTPCALHWDETKPGSIVLQGGGTGLSFRNMVLTPILR